MVGNWSPVYWLFRGYVAFAWWLFHRKIEVAGRENIPRGKPVVYAPNHPNALNDDLAIVNTVRHQVVWLGRADLFKSALARPFLRFLKIIPVYRIRDGKENLHRNDETFATAAEELGRNHAIGLYPEAAHSENRRMLPHKKGIPRIVFLAGEKSGFTLDIRIVPVGIYFDRYQEYGRRLLIIFGKPLEVARYYPLYRENELQAILALRNDLYRAILPLTLNFDESNHYEGLEALREIASKPLLREKGISETLYNRLLTDQETMGALGRLEAADPQQAGQLAARGKQFIARTRSLGIRNWLVDTTEEKPLKLLLRLLLLLFTAPLFAFGFLFNAAPFFLLDRIVKKKVKKEIFRSTFTFAAGILFFPLFYLLETAAFSPLLPGWIAGIFFLAALPFAGKFAWFWHILLRKTAGRFRWLRIKQSKPALYREIHREKGEILDAIGLALRAGN